MKRVDWVDCDVAVIGAGPAGSVAAALLAERGVRTVIVEKDTFPREKLCGDFISYDAAPVLEHLGAWDEMRRTGGVVIDCARIVAGRATRMFSLPRRSLALSRFRLDALLLACATKLGAVAMTGSAVESVDFDGDVHLLRMREGASRTAVRARVVVGAWGRWSRLDVVLGRRFVRSDRRRFGIAQYGVARRAEWTKCVDLYSFNGGYVGVAEVERARVNLCGLVDSAFLLPLRARVERWLYHAAENAALLGEEVAKAAPLDPNVRVSTPVIFAPRGAVVDHILMLGDAAVALPPVIGGGIAAAVQTALLAAVTSLQLLTRAPDRARLEHEYSESVARLLRARRRWARALGELLAHPKACEMILRAAKPEPIWNLLIKRTRSDIGSIERIVDDWKRRPTV